MSDDALIERLRTADPDRLTMALLAPRPARAKLLSLYALNDELARTALAAREPLVAEMRVQWWHDRLAAMADAAPPPHELLTPIYTAWGPEAAQLAALATARLHDAAREPFQTAAEVITYADGTGGLLMRLASGAVGAAPFEVVRAQGRGAALVAWLRARPALQALGLGVARDVPGITRALSQAAAEAFATARNGRREVPRSLAPVLFPGVAIKDALRSTADGADPAPHSDFARRAGLARLALTGRWWI